MSGFRHKGDQYKPAVLQIIERDHMGRPMLAKFLHEEQSVDLREAAANGVTPEFVIVFACREKWGAPQGG